jgi:general secretion pathway protein D
VGPSYPGFSATFLTGDLQVAVNAVASRSDIEVVSNPKIFVLDNHTGHLQVGDQVPVVTQTGQSTSAPGSPIVNTVEYRSTGVILNVTPRITGDGRVVLEVTQEVSSVASTTTSGIDSPTIQQRKMDSTLVLDDGGVVALGGLISTNRSRTNAGVPFFKDIPVVGTLFKTDSRTRQRTELVVLISVRILKNRGDADRSTKDLLADMREIEARGLFKP